MYLIRKPVKYLRITVAKGAVRVTAPLRLSLYDIEIFLTQKSGWIDKQLGKQAQRRESAPENYETGEMLRLWGESYPLSVISGRRNALRLDGGVAVLTAKPDAGKPAREAAVNEWCRRETAKAVEKRLPVFEGITGLKCSSWQVRSMTSRWGTCNTVNGKIWFSLHLAKKPPECLDYIIVHELAHLVVKNHGPAFKSLMDKFYPDWRVVRKILSGV